MTETCEKMYRVRFREAVIGLPSGNGATCYRKGDEALITHHQMRVLNASADGPSGRQWFRTLRIYCGTCDEFMSEVEWSIHLSRAKRVRDSEQPAVQLVM